MSDLRHLLVNSCVCFVFQCPGTSLRRPRGSQRGAKATTQNLAASAHVTFLDEHRRAMREHNSLAAALYFQVNNGGTLNELMSGRKKGRLKGRTFDLHGLYAFEAIRLVGVRAF